MTDMRPTINSLPVPSLRSVVQADHEAGWHHAPGDAELPPAVRATVENACADTGRDPGGYWVKYRPATDPFAEGDGYEVTLIPASIIPDEGACTVSVAVDYIGVDLLSAVAPMVPQFAAIGDVMATQLADVGNAIADLVPAAQAALGPIADLGRLFAAVVYLTDGPPPGPVTGPDSALAWLDYADTVEMLRRPPKRMRRRAKTRYLEVRRHLDPEHRRRLARVPVNRFGAQ
jgi:hypothetical protein